MPYNDVIDESPIDFWGTSFLLIVCFGLSIFISNIGFLLIGLFSKRKDRVFLLSASLVFYLISLFWLYYGVYVYPTHEGNAPDYGVYPIFMIITNSIIAIISLVFLIKEIKMLKAMRHKCANCGSKRGIKVLGVEGGYHHPFRGKPITVRILKCNRCGTITKDTWYWAANGTEGGRIELEDMR